MKVSPFSRRWLSIGLIAMLFALVSFSMMPLFTSLLKANRADPSGSVSLVRQQELESQATGYQLVLEREPDNSNALRGLLETRLQQGDLPKAIEPLERLARLNPQQTDYRFLLARTQQQIGDYEGAIASYRVILASYPGDMRALQGFTQLLTSQNRSLEAISAVKDTLARSRKASADPADPARAIDAVSVQLLLGKLYFERQEYAEALKIYDLAEKMDQSDFRPLLGQAIVLKEQGKTTAAAPLFQKALTLAPVAYHEDIKTLAAETTSTTPTGTEERSARRR
jgi:tetratricopeptide (TPR) repeat protein